MIIHAKHIAYSEVLYITTAGGITFSVCNIIMGMTKTETSIYFQMTP